MQQKEEVIRTIIKKIRDMGGRGKSFNIHLIRVLEEKKKMNRRDAIFERRMAQN